jgi:hypothetical protein
MVEAVGRAFETQKAGSDLVKRLLSWGIKPSLKNPVIVVFTGYGLALANFAREVSKSFSNAPIYVVGPDNLCAFDPKKRTWDAVTYCLHIRRLDAEKGIKREVLANASLDTRYTSGQSTVAARWIDEQGFKTALLVTAAYHQPRAYMTLLKSLIKRGIEERVQLLPSPYPVPSANWDWDAEDLDLKDKKPWARAFAEDELPKIIGYQQKGDVASWYELKECLKRTGI